MAPKTRKPATRKAPARKPAAKKAPARRSTSVRTVKTTRRSPAKKKPAAKKKANPLAGNICTYSHVTFRSQLEARWAIFFDALGLDWDYEPCHYPLGEGLGYLPDFYLPTLGLWAEGKGPTYLDRHAMGKAINAVAGPQPLPLREPPYWPNNGLVMLGPMQDLPDIGRPVHTFFARHQDAVAATWPAVWEPEGLRLASKKPWEMYPATGASPPRRPSPAKATGLLFPAHQAGDRPDPAVRMAYLTALATTFGPKGEAQLPTGATARKLSHRRKGRPLRPAGVPPASGQSAAA